MIILLSLVLGFAIAKMHSSYVFYKKTGKHIQDVKYEKGINYKWF